MLTSLFVHPIVMSFLQAVGLKELQTGADKFSSLRGPLCSLILVAYHSLIVYILGKLSTEIYSAQQHFSTAAVKAHASPQKLNSAKPQVHIIIITLLRL